MIIPPAFIESVDRLLGESGRVWLARAPRLANHACALWNLEIAGSPMHGALSLVIPVTRGDQRFALKIVRDAQVANQETIALRLWGGQGMVRLEDEDTGNLCLLLEWLDHEESLANQSLVEGAVEAGRLIRKLAIAPGFSSQHIAYRVQQISQSLTANWEGSGRAVPEPWVEKALAILRTRAPVARQSLVNWDLHFDNMLRRETGEWVAADPMLMIGDPEIGIAQLLWTNVDRCGDAQHLDRFFHAIVEAAHLDIELARAWTMFRLVDYWAWGLAHGLTEDPVRCQRIIEWLALDTVEF